MKLIWDETGSRLFETGVQKVTLYPTDSSGKYRTGVAWNGVISVTVSPSGGETTPIYANRVKIAEKLGITDFSGSMEAFTYPPAFAECIGRPKVVSGLRLNLQGRKRFGLCYRTELGNDILGQSYGYKLNILYGCLAGPSEKTNTTINDSPDMIRYKWDFSMIPVPMTGYLPVSHIEIVSTEVGSEQLAALEDILYGTEETAARLPLPDEIADILAA